MRHSTILILLASLVAVFPVLGDTVFFGGFLHYQESGKQQLRDGETLGSFVTRMGGIIRGEYNFNGKREVCHCSINVYQDGKRFRFRFGHDDAKAWAFRLQDGAVIEVAERMWIAPDKSIHKSKLKFVPAYFIQQKQNKRKLGDHIPR